MILCNYYDIKIAIVLFIIIIEQICIEDWIAFREMIIPIAVGSCLGLLLLIVLNLYIIVFIKRKVSERRGIRPHYKKIENK